MLIDLELKTPTAIELIPNIPCDNDRLVIAQTVTLTLAAHPFETPDAIELFDTLLRELTIENSYPQTINLPGVGELTIDIYDDDRAQAKENLLRHYVEKQVENFFAKQYPEKKPFVVYRDKTDYLCDLAPYFKEETLASNETLEDAALDNLDFFDDEDRVIEYLCAQFKEFVGGIVYDTIKNPHQGPPAREIIQDVVYDEYGIDLNIKALIDNTPTYDLDPAIYFGNNWDDDYHVESGWNDLRKALENKEADPTALIAGYVQESQLKWLIETQGYVASDIFDEAKRESSKFLISVCDEILHYINLDYIDGHQLVAIPDTPSVDDFWMAAKTKTFTIKAGCHFGLFNRIQGSSSGMSIVIEKDIVITPETAKIYDINLIRENEPMWYSPDVVIGRVKTNAEQIVL